MRGMKNRNICRFIPANNEVGGVNIINFVYETSDVDANTKLLSVYRAALVVRGEGERCTNTKSCRLEEGDLFFDFPSVPFSIKSDGCLEYMYISFIGVRANMLIDKLGINADNCVFHNMDELKSLWQQAIECDASDLRSEAVLLYTFSALQDRREKSAADKNIDTVIKIKQYIDENFNLPGLDLKLIGKELSYNEKYISSVFKRELKVGISEYIATIRVQYACTLINRGMSSVSDIALMCGYTDPLYFSKVFKRKMGESPRKHIAAVRSEM